MLQISPFIMLPVCSTVVAWLDYSLVSRVAGYVSSLEEMDPKVLNIHEGIAISLASNHGIYHHDHHDAFPQAMVRFIIIHYVHRGSHLPPPPVPFATRSHRFPRFPKRIQI